MVSNGKLLNDNIYKKGKKMMLIHISYLVGWIANFSFIYQKKYIRKYSMYV